MTVTFSLDLETLGGDGGLGLAEEEGGDREGLDGVGRDDVVEEEGVAGRDDAVGGFVDPAGFRERKGEMEDLCDLELEVPPENIAGCRERERES